MVRRTALLAVVAAVVMTTELHAQDQVDMRGRTYVFLGFGDVWDVQALHIGAGGEGQLYKGLNLGAELGLISVDSNIESVGLAELNGSYHFRGVTKSNKLVPFITGGPSLAIRYGVAPGFNVGGGFSYWFQDRMGLRTEFRSHTFYALNEFRIALTFRGKP